MKIEYIYFIYGLSVMFYGMMAWFFIKKNREILSRLVGVLMIVLALQCIKDLFFIVPEEDNNPTMWMIMTCTDMVTVPLYAFLLIELCRPGTLTWKMIVLQELPFVMFPVLFIITHAQFFYYTIVVWSGIYGFGAAVWAVIAIPKYHKLLKERFSYEENINLNWLRYILLSFFAVLSLWIIDCLVIDFNIEALYLVGSIIIWMFICYFIYRHESVIEEFAGSGNAELSDLTDTIETDISEIGQKISALFRDDNIFLNPNLKLSDIAKAIGTNRTYVSTFFNRDAGCTFYDYVNRYRVDFACRMLENSKEKINVIAEKSGFNSPQSFIRVFNKIKGVSPTKYRTDFISD